MFTYLSNSDRSQAAVMFKRMLSSLVAKLLPTEQVAALDGLVRSSTDEDSAIKYAAHLDARLVQLADAAGKPGLDRVDFDAALEALLQLERRGVWSSTEIRATAHVQTALEIEM